jgi:ATP-dependent Zn protease
MSEDKRRYATAVHEAGHGIICLERNGRLDAIDIVPGMSKGRHCLGKTRYWFPEHEIASDCMMHLAGPIAELVFFNKPINYNTGDLISVEKYLYTLTPQQKEKTFKQFFHDTLSLVTYHKPNIHRIAEALLERQYMLGEDVRKMIRW